MLSTGIYARAGYMNQSACHYSASIWATLTHKLEDKYPYTQLGCRVAMSKLGDSVPIIARPSWFRIDLKNYFLLNPFYDHFLDGRHALMKWVDDQRLLGELGMNARVLILT